MIRYGAGSSLDPSTSRGLEESVRKLKASLDGGSTIYGENRIDLWGRPRRGPRADDG